MPRNKPPIHGRDHRVGGSDPIPGLAIGMLHWGYNHDDNSLGLTLETSQQDILIETLGADVGQIIKLQSGGQITLLANSQLLLTGDTTILNGDTSVLIEGPTVQTLSGNIEEKLTSATDRWRVADAGGASILEILETGSISANSHKIHNVTNPTAAQDAATKDYVDAAVGGASVTSVFGRTGAVVAVTGDYGGVVASFLTGATQASRYVGATTSGAPVSGTFATGDFVIARDGHLFVCTSGGSPGTWVDVGSGLAFATPSIALGSAAAAGSAGTVIRSDATIAAFDTTAPTTQAFGDAAAVGTAAFAARRDHKHAMPPTPVTSLAKSGSSALTGAVTLSPGANVTLTQVGNDIAVAAVGGAGGAAFVATDQIWDTKGDTVAATGADAAVKVPVGTDYDTYHSLAAASAGVAWHPGGSVLLYDYTVAGSDKASIDTGVDTPDAGVAGTAAFPSLRLLEIWVQARTDEALSSSTLNCYFNNDNASGNYDLQSVRGAVSTASAAQVLTANMIQLSVSGASDSGSYTGALKFVVPNYAGTTFYKEFEGAQLRSNNQSGYIAGNYHNTAAITRFTVAPNTAGKKLKVGTRVLIYAR